MLDGRSQAVPGLIDATSFNDIVISGSTKAPHNARLLATSAWAGHHRQDDGKKALRRIFFDDAEPHVAEDPPPSNDTQSGSRTPEPLNSLPEATVDPTQPAPPCEATVFEVTIGGWDAATGVRAAALVVSNDESHACSLKECQAASLWA